MSIMALMLSLCSLYASTSFNNSDAIRFKEEYEKLNGMPRSEKAFALYNTTYISEDNPAVYIDMSVASDLLTSGSAIIYFGANWCPWCRNILPILICEMDRNDVDTLYYVDVTKDRDSFIFSDNDVYKEKDGSSAYYRILDILDLYLEDYTLTDDQGKIINLGEKRLLIPFIVTVSNGEIINAYLATYPLEDNQSKYDPLTPYQIDYLHNLFDDTLKNCKSYL